VIKSFRWRESIHSYLKKEQAINLNIMMPHRQLHLWKQTWLTINSSTTRRSRRRKISTRTHQMVATPTRWVILLLLSMEFKLLITSQVKIYMKLWRRSRKCLQLLLARIAERWLGTVNKHWNSWTSQIRLFTMIIIQDRMQWLATLEVVKIIISRSIMSLKILSNFKRKYSTALKIQSKIDLWRWEIIT